MTDGFDRLVAYHCAPTLMGHKAGSLFALKQKHFSGHQERVQAVLDMLERKGLSGQVIHCPGETTLIYLYRGELLKRHLDHPLSRSLLLDHGYCGDDARELVAQLIRRLKENSAFPHEIGLFLGYPPEDVEGFVKYKGLHCKHCGCWKVYGDVGRAKALFGQYAHCRRACVSCMNRGMTLDQMVAAG